MSHPTFTDETGRDWIVCVTIPDVTAIRETCNVDVLEVEGVAKLDRDMVKMVAVLWVLCERQASKIPLTPEDFGRMFSRGETLDAAAKALREALINFSRPHQRELIQGVLQKQEKLLNAQMRQAGTILAGDMLDRFIAKETATLMRKSLGELSGRLSANSPEPSESTSPAAA